jgi:hypothetical protein
MDMERETRYIVIKISDIEDMIAAGRMWDKVESNLENTLDQIDRFRKDQGKNPSQNYVVVGEDWPMYEDTWKAIEKWVDRQAT